MNADIVPILSVALIVYGAVLVIAARAEWDDLKAIRRQRPTRTPARRYVPPPATTAQRADAGRSHKWDSRTRTWH